MSRTKYYVPFVARFLLGVLLVAYGVLVIAGIAVTINFDYPFAPIYSVFGVWGAILTGHYIIYGRPNSNIVERSGVSQLRTQTTYQSKMTKRQWFWRAIQLLLPLVAAGLLTCCFVPAGFLVWFIEW